MIDRIASGDVTDFVRWHWHGHAWPIFNVADAVLLVGVVLLVVEKLAHRWPRRRLAA